MANLAPVVTVFDQNLVINSFLSADSFFSVTDPDGDPILRIRVFDFNDDPLSGHWELNGQPKANGSEFEINFSQLNKLFYIAGSAVTQEFLRFQAFDGQLWSGPQTLAVARTVNPTNTVRPVPNGQDISLLANEAVSAGNFVSAFDPDGYKIERYYIRDLFKNGTRFKLGNNYKEEGKFFYINADNMANLRLEGIGTGTETVLYYAYDGAKWSPRGTSQVSIIPNVNRPVGQFNSVLVPFGDTVNVWENILWTDADQNTAKHLWVYDRTDHAWSGHLELAGVPLAAKKWHKVLSSKFNLLTFVGGEREINEEVLFRVGDGRFNSANETLEFETVERPEVGSERVVLLNYRERIDLYDVFDQLDNGPPALTYEVLDTNGDFFAGKILLKGVAQPANQILTYTASQMRNDVQFEGGGFLERRVDPILVRTNNGATFGKWTRIDMRTEPNYNEALKVYNAPGNPNDWSDWKPPISGPPQSGEIMHELQYSFPNFEFGPNGPAENDWGCGGIDTGGDGILDTADGDGNFKIAQRRGVREALDYVSSIVNIDFVEVPENYVNPENGTVGGQLRHGNYWDPNHAAAAFAYYPSPLVPTPEGGDMWFNTANGMNCFNWDKGSFDFFVYLHELGHALGEKHSFEAPDPLPGGLNGTDNNNFSAMSYTTRQGLGLDNIQPHTYSIYDVLNLQEIYGARSDTAPGDDLYDLNSLGNGGFGGFASSIWDTGGNDTLSAEGSSADSVVDLRELNFSSIDGAVDNVGIAMGVKIENGIGSFFDDVVTGNQWDNVLNGGSGNDTMWGDAGDDVITGGPGNDRILFGLGDGDDKINEQLGAGRDTIEITAFPGLDFQGGIAAYRNGRDLILSLRPQGQPNQGELTIVNQAYGRYRMESLEIGTLRIDLTSVYDQTTTFAQNFRPIAASSAFGNLVVPV